MLSIDTNLLFYSLNPRSNFHEPAKQFLRHSFRDKTKQVAIADYALVELYLLLRNPKLLAKPYPADQVVEIVTSYLKIPSVVRVEHASVMDLVWKAAAEKSFARRKIVDIRLAQTLIHHGVTHFATANVKDFEQLNFERVWNPLLTK